MSKPKIGITIGDPNGIGLEVVLKTLLDERVLELCTPIIYGSAKVVGYHRNILGEEQLKYQNIRNANDAVPGQLNIINLWQDNVNITLGNISEEGGKYAALSLEAATQDALKGSIHALVTPPIHKKAMQMVNFGFPGHTEFLAAKAGVKDVLMILTADTLRVALVTGHIPLASVSKAINKENILRKLELLHASLRRDFGFDQPKIAVLGLNPHAGDEGSMGQEEQKEIIPAIQQAKKNGMTVMGPYSADGFFGSAQLGKFDAILAMYHDQGLAPFKALSFEVGVNFTAGLPFVRTSPDHGTAFDIAGQGIASEVSFRQALFAALDIYKRRLDYAEYSGNPLQTQYDEAIARESGKPDGVIL